MMYCEECKISVRENTKLCPLCDNALKQISDEEFLPAYPKSEIKKRKYWLLCSALIFASIASSIVCVIVNILIPTPIFWAPIAIAGVIYAWLVVPHALRRGGNLAGKVLMQVICTIGLVMLIDYFLGWKAWSVSFVAPMAVSIGIVAVGTIILCYRTNWAGYVMYQTVLALMSFIPLVLCFIGFANNYFFAIIAVGFGLLALAATFVFGDRSIKNEFKRRFRF